MARIAFRTLWTLEVRHAFWGGVTDVLRFVVPPSTQRQLAGVRAMAREREGRLYVLFETDEADAPLAPLAGLTLHFGLVPRSAAFAGVTADDGIAPGLARAWDNAADPNALAGPQGLQLTGPRPRLAAADAQRPLTMRLLDATGTLVTQTVLQAADDGWTPPMALPPGDWFVEEQGAGPAVRRRLRVDAELQGAWGLLDLTVDAGHLAAGRVFTLDFAATSDTLRYYVVASHFDAAQFAQVAVVDTGAPAEARPAIEFDRIAATDFGAAHLGADLLDPAGDARIALFQSRSAVARRAGGPRGLQLQRNGDVLVGHLPQPGADRHDAEFVVHLSQH
jgi:hypothetical protein